jgi:asparagine synthase (glutamine-hydrolysing)
MSGFAGVVSLDGAPPDAGLLERMVQTLAFRGPDGTHIATKPGAGFCFTFLRTGPAPQCSSQPCSLDGRIWLLGDVRLDGRDDLRRKLEQHGDEFDGDTTDEELILRAWRRWREDSLPDLIGDYSFALWDSEARHLWCARDLMGARPFFYAQTGNRLYFSNTLSTIRCVSDIPSALDHHFIGDFLLIDWCQDPARTAFREISRLPAGHVLRHSSDALDVRRYTSLPIEEPLWLKREEEYVERFREILEQVVRERLPRGPTAVLMSGGLDSTTVAGVASKIARKTSVPPSLRAYMIDCRPLFDDEEGNYASLAARSLNIPIEIVSAASCMPYEGWSDPGLRMPEPLNDPFLVLNQRQYQRVAAHGKVAWSGYGGDDILTGQAWPYLVYLFRGARFGRISRTFGGYVLKHRRIPPLRGGFRAKLRRWTGRSDPMNGYPCWIQPHFGKEYHLPERWRELQQPRKSSHPLHPIAYAGLSSGFWPGTLEQDDSAWTGVAVESRAPLLDQRLVRYLLRVPPVPWCVHKELLRRAVRGLLPEEIRLRPKTPLLGDPLTIFVESGRWTPTPLLEPSPQILTFANWGKVGACLANNPSANLWIDLRPVSVNYWLKTIESD